MKKILTILFMAIIMIVSLTGCKGEAQEADLLLKDGHVRVEFSEVEIINN